ncbi:MAG: hypothetical protein C4583_02475 [Anaerolineaceae bacterium]|nr:MAG: hypothetical protein C4583_02475 [Anaerolineaceae bacterium]
MNDAKWVTLIDVYKKMHADLVESYLQAHGIDTHLVQEAYYQYKLSAYAGPVQILVPNYQLDEARKLYEKTGWDFDTTETDDDEYDNEEGDE